MVFTAVQWSWILQILPLSPPARVDVLQQCSWQSSIFNYDSNTIIHSSIKSPDLQGGRWIECQCKHTKCLIMRQPFEHGNFTTHLLTHALAPSNQMSTIRSFFQAPSARSSQRPHSRATKAIRHRAALLQQPLDTTPSACMGSLFLPVDAYIKHKLLLLSKYGLSAIDVVVVRNVGTQVQP